MQKIKHLKVISGKGYTDELTGEEMNTISITVDIEDWYHKTFLQAKSFTIKPLKKF